MNTLEILKILDKDIRMNYNSKAEFAKKVGITRQRLNQIFSMLEENKKGNTFNIIMKILENSGYKIKISKN